ncbi:MULTISPECIES: L,D-transpeptidase family protein [Streptomyces]|uniref:L,D-TPase catalytic domain-containing protein n=1 Tax=Streptomyces venezuelae TaxID=54571 RepID=A0A5P2BF20_STRVZ|nr:MULTISPECIES: L,D-transpeptidase family protein [Streptomyces]NDZ98819.1 murein L,D-transpeptidase [Streptomyces sp. SID10116]MYY84494.1 L,D-transpeptidase family protein [Streptomyces sp. SID335]MYZ15386.1 L,D-transpeptidase family protein [Streptomyces sp. SID337]NDZ91198.1 murein L,D-transpeptidase [Streptomyces sp. SID10115]NEB50330.1 murein L,D-transpeptidase [Streptomyces sp. SID339]
MGRGAISAGAVAALVLVAGCKAVAVDAEGGPGGEDGKPGRTATRTPDRAPDRTTAQKPTKTPARDPAPRTPTHTPPPAPEPGRTLMEQGDEGKQVRELQARLRQIAWFGGNPTGTYGPVTAAAVKGFQAKRGLAVTGVTDTVTWGRLLGMTREPTRSELYAAGGMPPAKPDKRCLTGRVLCIAKSSRTLTWMIDGRAVSTMDVRFGSQYTPTREGTFDVYWKSRHHVSTLYDTPMPYAMFFSGGQAVHFSADFAARGYAGGSHGCVNVRDKKKIASLFAQVRTGDRVVIYK